jgi:hypothetical protein
MKQEIELGVDHPSQLSPLNSKEQALLATYDFLKHMSTLSIVAMGGMLGLAQGIDAQISGKILRSVIMVGLSGFLSLVFMAGVAGTQIRQRVHKSSNLFALIIIVSVLGLFSAGVGAFASGFAAALRH